MAQIPPQLNWGAPIQEVKRDFSGVLVSAEKDALVYKAPLKSGADYLVLKFFPARGLYGIYYVFPTDYANPAKYWGTFEARDKPLRKVYGKPINTFVRWAYREYKHQPKMRGVAISRGDVVYYYIWHRGEVRVTHSIFGYQDNVSHLVAYESRRLKPRDDTAKFRNFTRVQLEKFR